MKNRKHLMTSTLAILAVCVGSAIAQPPEDSGRKDENQPQEEQRRDRRVRESAPQEIQAPSVRQEAPRMERVIERIQERAPERSIRRESSSDRSTPEREATPRVRTEPVRTEPSSDRIRSIDTLRNRQPETEEPKRESTRNREREVIQQPSVERIRESIRQPEQEAPVREIRPERTPRVEREQPKIERVETENIRPVRTPREDREDRIRVRPTVEPQVDPTPRPDRETPTREIPTRENPTRETNPNIRVPDGVEVTKTPVIRQPIRTPKSEDVSPVVTPETKPDTPTQPDRPVRPIRPDRDVKPETETPATDRRPVTPVVTPVVTPPSNNDTRPGIRPTPTETKPDDKKPETDTPAQPGNRLPETATPKPEDPSGQPNNPGKPDTAEPGTPTKPEQPSVKPEVPGATPAPDDRTRPGDTRPDGTKPDATTPPDGAVPTPGIGGGRLPVDAAPPISKLPADLPKIPGATVPEPEGKGQLKPENFTEMVKKAVPLEKERQDEREKSQKESLENLDKVTKDFGIPGKLPVVSDDRLKIDREKPALIGSFVKPAGPAGQDFADRVLTGETLDNKLANIPVIKSRDRDYRDEDFELLRGSRDDRRWRDLRDDDWRRPYFSGWHEDYYRVRSAKNINININIFGPAYLPPPPPRPGYGIDYTSFRWNYWDGRCYYDSSYVLGLTVKLGHRRISGYDGYLVGGRYYSYGYGWVDGCIDYGDSRIWVPGYYRSYTVEECGRVPVWVPPTYEWVWTGCCWEEVQVGGGYFVDRPAGCRLVTRYVWVPGHYQYYRI